jgi:hypothetical protein
MGRWEAKVFWFVFSRKEKESSFSEEKEAKRLLFFCWMMLENTGLGRKVLWPCDRGASRHWAASSAGLTGMPGLSRVLPAPSASAC